MTPGWRDDRREFGLDAPEREPDEAEQYQAWLEAQADNHDDDGEEDDA